MVPALLLLFELLFSEPSFESAGCVGFITGVCEEPLGVDELEPDDWFLFDDGLLLEAALLLDDSLACSFSRRL